MEAARKFTAMKTSATCLYAAGLAAPECVAVEQVGVYQPSVARVRITALGEVVEKLKSEETERFAASLPIGTCIAFARPPAFRTKAIAFERVPASGSKELRIVLHLGSC
jgi:hypothetical protein